MVSAPKGIRTRYWLLFACCFSLDAIRAPSAPTTTVSTFRRNCLSRRYPLVPEGLRPSYDRRNSELHKNAPRKHSTRAPQLYRVSIGLWWPINYSKDTVAVSLPWPQNLSLGVLSSYQTKCTPYTKGGRVYRDIRKANFTTGTLVGYSIALHTRNCFPDSLE